MDWTYVQPMIFVLVGLCLGLVFDGLMRLWQRAYDTKRRSDAEKVLEKHGLSAYYYSAAFSVEDENLRDALTVMEHYGKIVLDKQGRLIGRVLPKVVKTTQLRLVVNNTKKC